MGTAFQLKVKALNLPRYRFIHTPNSYVHITIDDDHSVKTCIVRGSNPEWNECFDISLEKSSTIALKLFHVPKSGTEVCRGTTSISVKDSLHGDQKNIVLQHNLEQVGGKDRTGGLVEISLCRMSTPQTGIDSGNSTGQNNVAEENPPAVDAPKKRADDVLAEVDRAEAAAPKSLPDLGTTMDTITAVSSSDLCSDILGYVNKVVEFGDVLSQVHPYAQTAWRVLTMVHKALEAQAGRDDKIRTLLQTIRDVLEFVGEDDAFSRISKMQAIVSSIMDEIHKCALFIQEYGAKGRARRIIVDNLSTTTDDRIEQFISEFNRLKEKFDRGLYIGTYKAVDHVASMLEGMQATESDEWKILKELPGWDLKGVKFDETKACHDGTRKQLLDDIRTWVNAPDGKCILWLSGGAGTGKTSVANSVAVFFENLGRLGASFCFNRDIARLNNTDHVFGNVCFQLAHFDKDGILGVKNEVLSAIRSMGYVASSSLRTQARKLVVEATTGANLTKPVVVIIDALDESGTTQARKGLLEAIAVEFPNLPPCIKIMITSRDEPDIRISLQDCSKEVSIDDVDNTAEDIASYMRHRLTAIQRRSHLREGWPGPEKFQELENRAGGLFIWASVACNFVEEKRNPVWRLDRLLDTTQGHGRTTGSPLKMLDILYTSILNNAFPDAEDSLADFRYVVGSIIVVETPLTRSELDSLLGIGDEKEGDVSVLQDSSEIPLLSSDEIISPLRSILRVEVTDSGKEGQLRLLHPSLYEFLTTRVDEQFRIDPTEQHRILATRCVTVMNNQLKFDICEISNPSLLNEDIEDLVKRINDNISDGLRYSCRSFSYHILKLGTPDSRLRNALCHFISEHILHWIEVMSLLEEITKAENCLRDLTGWIKDHASDEGNVLAIAVESIALLRNFGRGIRVSALHTYFSALALAPKTGILFRHFASNVPCIPDITSSHPTSPTASVRIMEGHTDRVRHVVFTPDGKKLISASDDKTVRIWDVESGEAIGEPLRGHTDWVRYVAISLHGKKLASVSDDRTARIWDVENGETVGGALEGHTDRVSHAVFSLDGMTLASASRDNTVRIWDADSGAPIGGALKGHTDWIGQLVFSPDGKKLASTSDANMVRIWDLNSGAVIGGALKGHTDWISHVVFSPDGNRLASASDDMTARIWEVQNGAAIGVLEGHAGGVFHVAFSPDGKKLASASDDTAVRIWDVESGTKIGGALRGHTMGVGHVAFSPDGKKLASASNDKTVRIWDVNLGEAIGGALKGHADSVLHVTFSPDGNKLASASEDHTVRIWDITAEGTIEGAFEGHTGLVTAVVFSPDRKKLASASRDNTVRIWDVESGAAVGGALKGHTAWVHDVVFSPNGKQLASLSFDCTVRIWDAVSGTAVGGAFGGHNGWVYDAVFSPDGKKLASWSDDRTVKIWDVESGASLGVLSGHTEYIRHADFSPDGKKLASASQDKMVRIWDVESGVAVGEALEGHTAPVCHVVFSPNGKKLASASNGNMVWVWDVESGIGGALEGHHGMVSHVVFSQDGSKLASASNDKTVRLWDVESGKGIGTLKGHTSSVLHVAFSPDGTKLVSASDDRTVRVWDLKSRQFISEGFDPYIDNILNPPWTSDHGFTACSDHDPPNTVADSVVKIVQSMTGFDHRGFLVYGTARLMWLHPTLRGRIAVQSSVIAVGGQSGAVTFIRMPDHMRLNTQSGRKI